MGIGKAPKITQTPVASPDLAAEAVRKASVEERQRQLASSGRKSTFLSGALGDTSTVPTTLRKLIGS